MVASERLRNPVPFTEASVNRGRVPFTNFCVPCHGVEGKGDGPVAAKFVPPPPFAGDHGAHRHTDGFIYATIRQGSLSTLMPAYGPRLTEQERWDLVNYVRALQGAKPRPDPGAPVRKTMRAPAPETTIR
jgi:putative copper resistance protein D